MYFENNSTIGKKSQIVHYHIIGGRCVQDLKKNLYYNRRGKFLIEM